MMQAKPSDLLQGKPLPFRLAAVDLDETLLGPDKQISPQNAAAVRRLQAQGIRVMLASGRKHENMLGFHHQLGLEGPIVSSGGALVKHAETGEVLLQSPVAVALAKSLAEEGVQRGVTLIVYHFNGVYVYERTPWVDLYEKQTGEQVKVCHDLQELTANSPLKVIWADEAERISQFLSEMRDAYGDRLDLLTTEPYNLEFTTIGVNKAVGIAVVAEKLGIHPTEILAFGDGNNDVSMLKWAGLGVAMSHARASAQAAADLIAPEGDRETSFARAVEVALAQTRIAA
ncbi:Cof-type HAD-IIB family hydrolase [Kovacikia minuta CCNUW1]|uniref:Cof-type HAD-IIB family hydrolase n=1 Tax=Kovacikia minuta TaxID=2931930 RepID=UPI001CCC0BA5|nr:Cof-type HAD-IIB family hydrolase [Kovacikia minuta]UBF27615.1 Cof-type HAD-IIB family hydrolase [Kovacikia minuta CCNUW1]